jgi:hypothetical protein
MLRAKAGSLSISDDGEVGMVLRLGSELRTSMEIDDNIQMKCFRPGDWKEKYNT